MASIPTAISTFGPDPGAARCDLCRRPIFAEDDLSGWHVVNGHGLLMFHGNEFPAVLCMWATNNVVGSV